MADAARDLTNDPAAVALLSVESPLGGLVRGRPIELGEMVSASSVQASNIVRDVREMVTNALGGRMRRYEALLDLTMERVLERYRAKLAEQGYDGAVGVRFAHPTVADGGAELIVYGTGFRYADR